MIGKTLFAFMPSSKVSSKVASMDGSYSSESCGKSANIKANNMLVNENADKRKKKT